MKTPSIRSWDCVDHDPIEEWIPDDPSDVEFWCNIAIGISGEEGSDNFLVHIATSKAVSRITDKKYLVIIPYYEDWKQVLTILQTIVETCKGINWQDMSEQLSDHFQWEYASMR